jgi:hypothetical protein
LQWAAVLRQEEKEEEEEKEARVSAGFECARGVCELEEGVSRHRVGAVDNKKVMKKDEK